MAILLRHKNSIYQLNATLDGIGQSVVDQTTTRQAQFGTLASLLTADQSTLVAGINGVLTEATNSGDTTLKKADNLSDLADIAVARTNLGVMEKTTFDDSLQVAKLSLGTNHVVENQTERDALTTLTLDDRVLVRDIGDGTWASYKPIAIDGGSGAVTDWVMIYSQTAFEAVNDTATLRTTYASNADTNVFRDADQTELDLIDITSALDLQTVIYESDLITDMAGHVFGDHPEQAVSVDAAKAYIEGVASVGGLVPALETITVSGDQVTLAHPPINGIAGICNFATARFVDENGVSFDASLQTTGTNTVFSLALPTSGLWDGRDIQVQYYHFLDMSNYEEQDSGGSEGIVLEGNAGIQSTATDDDHDGWIDQGILPET